MSDLELKDPAKAFVSGICFPGGGYFYIGEKPVGVFYLVVCLCMVVGGIAYGTGGVVLFIALTMLISARGARKRSDHINRKIELEMQREHRSHLSAIAHNTKK